MSMTMTKAKTSLHLSPLQTLKVLVMLNSLVLLFILFLAFINTNQHAIGQFGQTTDISNVSDIQPTAMTASVDKELVNLPYVSATGLQQQAVAQVVSYQQQPMLRARSSR